MYFLSLLLLLTSTALLAQPKGWRELTISDGLSQGMIFGIKQDKKGFVWVATKDGLNRYDGTNFNVFTHDPYNVYSLSDNACSALLVDKQGRLWVGTLNKGLNLYDARKQRFYHININDLNSPNAGNDEVRLLAEDPDGNIWVNTDQDKLYKITLPDRLKTNFPDSANFTSQVRFRRITLAGMASNGSAHHIEFKPDGTAIAGTTYGMCAFDWRRVTNTRPINRPSDAQSGSWNVDDDTAGGGYWFSTTTNHIHGWWRGTHKAIRLPDKTTSTLVKMPESNRVIVATLQHLWVMSPDRLMALDSLTAQNALTPMPPIPLGLTHLINDQTGLIWIGTAGYGLRVFNPKIKQFTNYLPNVSPAQLYEDQQGRSYAQQFVTYSQIDYGKNRLVPFLDKRTHQNGEQSFFLMQDRTGYFWESLVDVNKRSHQLLQYDPMGQFIKRYPLPAQTAFGLYLNQTVEDKHGYLWIGATNGKLVRFNQKTKAFTVFDYHHLLPQSGAPVETSALYFDRSGTIWIGTPKGLIRADHLLTNPSYTIYKNSLTDRQSLSNDAVSNVIDDPYEPLHYLWVSTKGGGLERLDKRTGQFRHFTEAQGLPNKVVYGILVDAFKNLWISTNRGLAQVNPRTFAFRNFTKADGLQDDEFNTGSFFRRASGKLVFGGVNGLTELDPRDFINQSGVIPQAHIVGLKVNNESIPVNGREGILPNSIENTTALDLSYDQNGITLEFAVMDFTNPPKNWYRYRLAGIDGGWIEASTNRFANYAKLPYGNYKFQMSGSSDGQNWSEPVQLQLRIHPPFYRTWWAYLFYVLLVAGGAWRFYRVRTRHLLLEQRIRYEQKEATRLAELDGLKTQFFTSISHEFRTPLTLILGPLADLRQRLPAEAALGLMERNGQRLLNLINQLLDLSKMEAGQLRIKTEPGDLAAFLRTLASSFSALADSRQIRFSFAQNKDEYWTDFDRDKLEKIVTNLLSNAIKFTPAGKEVRMLIQYPGEAGPVQLTIQDTGIGIATEHVTHIFNRFYQVDDGRSYGYEGTGIGLALVNELIRVLNGQIGVNSTEGVGTTFTITLPLAAGKVGPLPPSAQTREQASPAEFDFRAAEVAITSVTPIDDDTTRMATDEVLLIIDDNPDIRAYVRSIFEPDYQVMEAVDGQDGLDKATQTLPDVVICDLMMPRLDGFGFCRALKAQSVTSHIPVVMLTAKATTPDRIEGFELGADDYLTKPFNRVELHARVRNLVQQRQRLYHWFGKDRKENNDQLKPAALPPAEQLFVDRLATAVNQRLDDTTFTVEDLAGAVHLGRVQLHRKLKAVANTTATQFIRDIRLAKAAELLSEGKLSVTQVAYSVGFDNLSYFAKVFQEKYGSLPSQYGKLSLSQR